MRDDELVELLLRWGLTPNLFLGIVLLCVLVPVNIFLFLRLLRLRRTKTVAQQTAMDWRQTSEEIEIDFPLPAQRPARGDIECKTTSSTIRFAFRGDTSPMLEGTLYQQIEFSNWQLWPVGDAPTHVKLTLVKARPATWPALLSKDATGALLVEDGSNKPSSSSADATVDAVRRALGDKVKVL